jgi:hypothetical protein
MAILKILHEKKVTMADFITTDQGNVRLRPSAVKIVLDEIAKQLSGKTFYKGMMREWQIGTFFVVVRARHHQEVFFRSLGIVPCLS